LPTISVDPASIIDDTLTPGSTFTVDLLIADANIDESTEAYAWQVMMSWDNTVLDIDDAGLTFGDFMDVPRIGPWGELTADADAGQNIVNVVDGTRFATPGAWGGEVLIQDDFNSETKIVVSQDGNQLTLQSNLANSYTVAAGGGAYPRPTLTPGYAVGPAGNRVLVGQTTQGVPPGVSGSGLLCTLAFDVLATGDTVLDINDPFVGDQTFITNSGPAFDVIGDESGELNKESGYFSNVGVPPEMYTLSISVVGSGTTDPAVGDHVYAEGTVVDVLATASGGWVFKNWTLDGGDAGSANPLAVTMDADHTLVAFFDEVVGPLIFVDPAATSIDPPGSFTINVSITDAVDLFSYEVKLGYNPSILSVASILEGPFIKDQTTSPLGTLWSTVFGSNYVYATCVTLGA
ncbi:MAG: hypothetical protein GTO14_05910, partial [Anaerolineales bacterium]|nr:hypothetical protein [Anaerolineae bacterium]NIS79736.1 hypothetical protein [Anaerolineales bacterium]